MTITSTPLGEIRNSAERRRATRDAARARYARRSMGGGDQVIPEQASVAVAEPAVETTSAPVLVVGPLPLPDPPRRLDGRLLSRRTTRRRAGQS